MKKTTSKLRFRLHWLSWLTLVLMLLCMTVIVVPGISVPSNEEEQANASSNGLVSLQSPGFPYNNVFSHGWPCEYMRRELPTDVSLWNRIDWTFPCAWPNGNTTYSYELSALIIDLLVAAVIVAVCTIAVEFWRRRRKRVWFSLFDLFAALTLVAVVISWHQRHANDYAAESDAFLRIGGTYGSFAAKKNLDAPGWLVRLLGDSWPIQRFWHVTEVTIYNERWPANESTDWFFRYAANFKRAEAVNLNWPVPPQLPDFLSGLKNVQRVKIGHPAEAQVYGFVRHSLPNPSSGKCSFSYDGQVRELVDQKLRSLEILPELNQVEHLTAIELNLGYISRSAWQKLPPLSQVHSLSFASYEVFVEDLAVLERFENLQKVSFWMSATNQELEDFQRKHPQLKISGNRSIDLTDLQLNNRRIITWLIENTEYRDQFTGPECSDDSLLEILDLKAVNLTEQKLDLANADFGSIEELVVGAFDSIDTVNRLIKKCPELYSLDLSEGHFTEEHLRRLAMPGSLALIVSQCEVTAKDFIDLEKRLRPKSLVVTNAIFSAQDIAEFKKAWPDTDLDIWELDEDGFQGSHSPPPGQQAEMVVYFYRDDD